MKIEKITIPITGMHCASCAKLIESKVGSLKGVESIKVNLLANMAELKFDSDIINLNKIKSEIRALGYCKGECTLEEKDNNKKGTIAKGIMYGLIPHIGCIMFLIASILGSTLLMQYFKPLLLNRNIFYYLILISIGFATLSSVIYLKKNGLLSLAGIRRKKGYLAIMYGSTIGINLILFFLIFPLLANVSAGTGLIIADSANLGSITLKVNIPCPGHAPLITTELKTIEGVSNVKFSFPNKFDVLFDKTKTSKEQILALEVFKTYKATEIK